MSKKIKSLFVIGALLIGVLACNLPGSGQLPFSNTTTPDFTMTALFSALLTPTPGQMVAVTDTVIPQPSQTDQATIAPTDTSVPTQPATPTNTALPPTPTPPPPVILPQRGTGAFVIRYMYNKPTLDGNWDDFPSQIYSANTIVYGASNWTGPDDLSSSFKLAWDNTYLYVAAKVRDDKYVQNATGSDIYKGDSIEVLLDTNFYGDFYTQQLNSDDYQLGVSPGNPNTDGKKEAFLWFPRDIAGSRSQVKIGSDMWQNGYRVEAAIPWSLFGVTPYAGEHFGFVFSTSDNDNESNAQQDSMASSDPGRHLTNPTTWQELVLSN
ncbi:MAG: sugar-binding protein [Anaerolineaceae bacterium]|nr:sugar-binding protein [Anaerolineaceae bacterium]